MVPLLIKRTGITSLNQNVGFLTGPLLNQTDSKVKSEDLQCILDMIPKTRRYMYFAFSLILYINTKLSRCTDLNT